MDKFEKAIVAAIVEQFFVGVEYRNEFGVQRQDPPATKIASQMIQTHFDEIMEAVFKKLDKEKLANEIVDKLVGAMKPGYFGNSFEQKGVQNLIWEKYAEKKAEQMIIDEHPIKDK